MEGEKCLEQLAWPPRVLISLDVRERGRRVIDSSRGLAWPGSAWPGSAWPPAWRLIREGKFSADNESSSSITPPPAARLSVSIAFRALRTQLLVLVLDDDEDEDDESRLINSGQLR